MNRHAAVILAAGRGSRFAAGGGAGETKLVAPFRGEPLVRHAARAALASEARPVIVVTGHARDAVAGALAGLPLTLVHNPAFADGMSTSLGCGLAAVPDDAPGAVVILADMPGIASAAIDSLIGRAREQPAVQAVVPTHAGRRGNPVLLSRALFERAARLSGDRGARGILADPTLMIEAVEQPATILDDIDHPDDLARLTDRHRLGAVVD